MANQKYYVVWKGKQPGIYTTWAECQEQVIGVAGAVYKSFKTEAEARTAYESLSTDYERKSPSASQMEGETTSAPKVKVNYGTESIPVAPPTDRNDTVLPLPLEVTANALAVDAACSGNPGPMEYRGVYLATGQEIFHYGPVRGTNNIGEFLAIVHGLALLKQKGLNMTIYSDSRIALLWVKARKCRTNIKRDSRTEPLFQMIERAENWLKTHDWSDIPLLKWETSRWGEVPADFGRK